MSRANQKDNPKIVSRQVWECAQGLNELAKVNFVNLIWVPGHSGILGNEKADYLASTARSEPFIGANQFYQFHIV